VNVKEVWPLAGVTVTDDVPLLEIAPPAAVAMIVPSLAVRVTVAVPENAVLLAEYVNEDEGTPVTPDDDPVDEYVVGKNKNPFRSIGNVGWRRVSALQVVLPDNQLPAVWSE